MKKQFFTPFFIIAGMAASMCTSQAQNVVSSTIQVRITETAVLNTADCDAIGDSDYAWHFIATDNTLGNTNNSPTDTDYMGAFNFSYRNGNNGPYAIMPNDGAPDSGWDPADGLFFNHFYCGSDIPTAINIKWRAYENDDIGNYSMTNSPDGNSLVQTDQIPVPTGTGDTSVLFYASGSSGGCPQNYSIIYEVKRIDVLGDAPVDMLVCQGDTVNWYGTPYAASGTYDYVMTAQTGCDSILRLNLTVNPTITAGLTVNTNVGDTICAGQMVDFSATPTAAGNNPSYQWFVNGQNAGSTDVFSTNSLNNGDVVLCVMTVDTFCVADSTITSSPIALVVEACLGGTPIEEEIMWNIRPNPASNLLYVNTNQMTEAVEMRFYSATGALLRQTNIQTFPHVIETSSMPDGLYLLQLQSPKGIYTEKIIIQK